MCVRVCVYIYKKEKECEQQQKITHTLAHKIKTHTQATQTNRVMIFEHRQRVVCCK